MKDVIASYFSVHTKIQSTKRKELKSKTTPSFYSTVICNGFKNKKCFIASSIQQQIQHKMSSSMEQVAREDLKVGHEFHICYLYLKR